MSSKLLNSYIIENGIYLYDMMFVNNKSHKTYLYPMVKLSNGKIFTLNSRDHIKKMRVYRNFVKLVRKGKSPDDRILENVKRLVKKNFSIKNIALELKISNYTASKYFWKVRRGVW